MKRVTEASEETAETRVSPLAWWIGVVPLQALAMISCAVLFMMMTLTFIDVAGRYIFNSPLPALAEVIAFMMAGLVFCVLPLVCFREGHVTIDLLDGMVPPRLKRPQGIFINLVAAGAVLFIAWRLWVKAEAHLEFGDATDELYMDIWPFSTGMAILCVLAAVAQLAAAVAYVIGARDDPAKASEPTT